MEITSFKKLVKFTYMFSDENDLFESILIEERVCDFTGKSKKGFKKIRSYVDWIPEAKDFFLELSKTAEIQFQ